MLGTAPTRRAHVAIDRSRDRVVTAAAIALAAAFLVAALGSALLPAEVRHRAWLPLHLALAGGATTAIAGVMPFFTAAFAAAPPSDVRLRVAAVLVVALGAAGLAVGVVAGVQVLAGLSGVTFIAGVALIGAAALRPLQRSLGRSRGIVAQGYVMALVEVGVGATLATLYVAGWPAIVGMWATIKPAHAWLNLVGFVSLVIGTTLLHFFPTVVGARIVIRRSARITVLGLATGPAIVATAFVLQLDLVARAGALLVIAGAVALALYARETWGTRGHWTTNRDWHEFTIGGLLSALAWFEIGMAIAALRVLVFGSAPGAWSIDDVVGPLVAGWIGLAILASATHLVPAVGPGDSGAHARQRTILGRWSRARLLLANLGVAALAAGASLHVAWLVVLGAALAALALAATLRLLVAALTRAAREP
jgi:hypothetical protein